MVLVMIAAWTKMVTARKVFQSLFEIKHTWIMRAILSTIIQIMAALIEWETVRLMLGGLWHTFLISQANTTVTSMLSVQLLCVLSSICSSIFKKEVTEQQWKFIEGTKSNIFWMDDIFWHHKQHGISYYLICMDKCLMSFVWLYIFLANT